MGLTDDPIYKAMTEGEDAELIVGTIEMGPPDKRIKFPVYIIDYTKTGPAMEGMVAQMFNDDLKKIDLAVREGKYTVSVGKPRTIIMFSEGETAAHTAPDFWSEHMPTLDEHNAFQREYKRMGHWLFIILTKEMFRQFAIAQDGSVVHKLITPMNDNLRKSFNIKG